ncbi:MAG TPA: isopentenyl-diphosphate Delta-isomerase [Actinomycetota bacterium]|jgi:isopentenyl-diphosphate delta-isomerase|nr:isopentenyl-diphosphate Delta-isomerase [Actinomycetota bacterium]
MPRPPERPASAGAPAARAAAGDELVVLLDPAGRPIGSMPKAEAHLGDTPLHLAFSVYVFDPPGRFLATRRALAKPTWPGVWTNSCCGHPRPGESAAAAARRRLREELGLVPARLDLVLPGFSYRAVAADGVVENELCPVFFAHLEGGGEPVVTADPAEVAEWRWVSWPAFCTVAVTAPWALSPWAAAQVPQLPG